jgi:dihydroflavonol-4-reductase
MDMLKMPPMINEYSIRKLSENFNFSNAKAREQLGYNPRPLIESLRDSAEWLLANDKK